MDESTTRLVPIAPEERRWAHHRPPEHRVPLPAAGEQVMYRHDTWGPTSEAQVLAVQPLDDLDDPHLWTVETDASGRALMLDGRPVLAAKPDPWPKLTLSTRYGRVVTREARLRGSPGWLPLDWQTRHRPTPADMTTVSGGG